MRDQTGVFVAWSVPGLLGALTWKYRKAFLAQFHANYLKEVERKAPWALGVARLIVRGQRIIIHIAAVIWLAFGAMGTLVLVLRLAGIDLVGRL